MMNRNATVVEILDARLNAASQRTATETTALREENHRLRELLAREQALAKRLEKTLAELREEREAVNAEARRLLSPQEWQEWSASQTVR